MYEQASVRERQRVNGERERETQTPKDRQGKRGKTDAGDEKRMDCMPASEAARESMQEVSHDNRLSANSSATAYFEDRLQSSPVNRIKELSCKGLLRKEKPHVLCYIRRAK
eukprot:s4089_g3.t1